MITSLRKIQKSEAPHQILRGLKSLTNVDFLTELLCNRHNIQRDQRSNAREQATSIRSCLEKALEYRGAAIKSDYARPTLIYYSMMSFALCEILLKRDGNFRLQKLRENHAHHGLDFSISEIRKNGKLLASQLSARPRKRGTFAVWHEQSSYRPVWGQRTVSDKGVTTSGIQILGNAPEGSPDIFPEATLLRLAEICPAIFAESSDLGIKTKLVRATLKSHLDKNRRKEKWELIIHPTSPERCEAALEKITLHPRCIDIVQIHEFASGGGFSLSSPIDATYVQFQFLLHFQETAKLSYSAPTILI